MASVTRSRASPRISAQVSSAGAVLRLPVPHTGMPRSRAASTSMTGLRRPVLTISRRRGSAVITSRGSGVRSRIATTTSYAASRSTSAAGSTTWSAKVSTSTRPSSGDQSATSSATCW